MWRKVMLLGAVVAIAGMIAGTAQAQLAHRYSFDDLTDSVGDADGAALGDAGTLGGQALVNLGFFGDMGTTRNGRIDLLANGANGININTYSSATIEFWATPNCAATDGSCAPWPNDGFHTTLGFGNTYQVGVPDGPVGAGADYIIMQSHRGTNTSRGAIAVTTETMGAPWGAETGVDGPEFNDGAQHHYALVITGSTLEYYVDGASMGTAALANPNSHGNANVLSGVSNANAWIGSAYEIDPRWSGAMNELRIWNQAAADQYVAGSFAAGPDQLASFIAIPEPASLLLALLGLAGFVLHRRKASS